jgi:hypothetical protein
MKHVTKLQDFIAEAKKPEKDYMMYMQAFKKALEFNAPGRHFQIKDVMSEGSASDDFTGEGWGEGTFTMILSPAEISFSYEIEVVKDHGDETADMKVHIDFSPVEANRTISYDHDLKKQSLPDFHKTLKELVKEDLAKLAKEY